MMIYNYHTHTKRCNHAGGEDREYVENAIQGGVKTLGFSDHAPYLFPNTDYYSAFRMRTDELFDYAESVRTLQREYAKDIRILLGFELEYYPDLHAEEMRFLEQVKPDYRIMGQHFGGNEIGVSYAPAMSNVEQFSAYISQVIEGLKTGDFAYLAHPDLAGYRYPDEVVLGEYTRLCEAAKRLHIPLEINLLGLRTNRHYPNRRFFEIAASVGNDIVIGADAHEPIHVCDVETQKKALQMIRDLNLKLIEKPFI